MNMFAIWIHLVPCGTKSYSTTPSISSKKKKKKMPSEYSGERKGRIMYGYSKIRKLGFEENSCLLYLRPRVKKSTC